MPAPVSPTRPRTYGIDLPAGFRPRDVLAFHGRDAEQVAERVDGTILYKGITRRGRPTCLRLALGDGRARARLTGEPGPGPAPGSPLAVARRILGLAQPVEDFEAAYRDHPQLGPLIARQAGLRVPLSATPFEALMWAITGQQISVSAVVGIRRRLIRAAGLRHAGGLWCHPEAAQVAALGDETLRRAGLSAAKARSLAEVCRQVESGRLPLEAWTHDPPAEEIRERLLAVAGIGEWTVGYVLLRGYGWLDGSLHGDVAVRRGLRRLLARPQAVTADEARAWLAPFTPWRALVAAHLWALEAAGGY